MILRVRRKFRNYYVPQQCLSAGGKEVLIKSVAQSIHTYSMACFKLPRGLCEHINSIIRKFWWGSKNGQRKTAWVSWNTMTKPKFMGGLGFRDVNFLTWLYSPDKFGDCYRNLIRSAREYLELVIIPVQISWMPLWARPPPRSGDLSWKDGMFFLWASLEGLGQERAPEFGATIGCRETISSGRSVQERLIHPRWFLLLSIR